MIHSASLTDPTVAYSPFNPYGPSTFSTSAENHIANGHACSANGLSPASSATVAALTAVAAASAGIPPNIKDSRWLTLEVCRQYQRNQCSRDENECKFAHPPAHVDVQNGRVVCCYDSIKGKCQRRDPPCKYLHPPQHLREQLMQNGRNNMIIRNMQLQLFQQQLIAQTAGILPFNASGAVATCTSPGSHSTPLTGTTSPNSMLYPGPGTLALGTAPTVSNAYSFLNLGFTPYLTALTGSTLNGASGLSELIPTESSTTPGKRTHADHKAGANLSLYLSRPNGTRVNGTCDGTTKLLDGPETSGPCVMVVNGTDSLKDMNNSSHSVPVTIRSTNGSTMAPATIYALQPPPPQAASLLNLPSHQQHGPIASLSAASLAAVVNGSLGAAAGGALGPNHFSAIPDHPAFFHPQYHFEIPAYPYR